MRKQYIAADVMFHANSFTCYKADQNTLQADRISAAANDLDANILMASALWRMCG